MCKSDISEKKSFFFLVGEEEIELETTEPANEICISSEIFIATMAASLIFFTANFVSTGFSFHKYCFCKKAVNIAKQIRGSVKRESSQRQFDSVKPMTDTKGKHSENEKDISKDKQIHNIHNSCRNK